LYSVWEDQNTIYYERIKALTDFINEGPFHTNPDSAIILSRHLYEFTKNKEDSVGMVDALNLYGYIFFRMGNYPKALSSYQQGLSIAETIGYKLGSADILLRTGYIYHDNEDFINALKYYDKSFKIYEELDDIDGKGSIYNELGSIHRVNGDYEKALDYYLKSIAINNEIDFEIGNAAMYINIGDLYLAQDNYVKSLEYYRKGLALEEKNKDKLGIASALSGIGNVYIEQGNSDKALDLLQKSLRLSEEVNDTQGSTAILLSISDIYLDNGNYYEAIIQCEKSLLKAKSVGDLGGQEDSYGCLYDAHRALGNIYEALIAHEQMITLADSVQYEETAIKLQQMEFSKQIMADSLLQIEKDLEVQMKHQAEVQRKDQYRNLAIGVGLIFLLFAIGFFSRWRYVKKSEAIIAKERDRSEQLLLNILPADIAEELKEKGEAEARDFDLVSILFTDFKGFTEKSATLTAAELIGEINHCFKAFDLICEKYAVEKIKTIGDAYMAAGGLQDDSSKAIKNTILAALEMQAFITHRIKEKKVDDGFAFEMRLGIHTGPVVAGIVGVKKFQYDIWGDTVNTASRMESSGAVGKVNISQNTYELIMNDPEFTFEYRGKIKAKGKGIIEMWFVEKSNLSHI
ncbi:MAG: adenylate/guanylate cyclase domain-containing protein, partial [Eudoraea sp.]